MIDETKIYIVPMVKISNKYIEEPVEVNILIDKYLTSKGWKKCNQPRKTNNKKYTGIEFCSYLKELNKSSIYKRYNRVVANIGGHHIVAIIDYKVNDTWNSTMGSIGTYWIKEK